MNTDFLIEKSVQIRQIRVIRVPNHGNSQRARNYWTRWRITSIRTRR